MIIKKIGHCCLLVKLDNGVTVLTDPGTYSTGQNDVTGIDLVLITHEHADHFHIESLAQVLAHNPNAQVITNSAVGKKLDEANIAYTLLEGDKSLDLSGVLLEAHDCTHEEIFEEFGQVQNTGYFIDGTLFYPGDAFCDPHKPVEILALPVAGPWCRIRDSIRYAISLAPKKVFPVHDGNQRQVGVVHRVPSQVLPQHGIEWVSMNEGDEKSF